ncbi:hypothetical protein [Paludibacter sp. 221]|uniref:hypothetical protein n=1 Tax=Paludibacter sp. 221 TaxID=2302939 RepID=UPI0013D03DAF|nr:hypothetical protein [Paludibacter sp. 221]
MKHLPKHINKWIPFVLFLAYYISITGFVHAHYIEGKTIIHSHPYHKSNEHQHSSGTCQLIQQISHFNATNSFFTSALTVFFLCAILSVSNKAQNISLDKYYRFLFCRPPPSFC